jgi:hypothetical protein
MKIFTTVSVLFISLSVLAAGGGGDKKHHHIFPRKEANKALSDRPGTVELLEPKALSQVSGTEVTLKWKPVENAESYKVQVATDPNFKWIVSQVEFHNETDFKVSGLEAGKHYFWRVFAKKPGNEATFSTGFGTFSSFEVK